MKKTNRPVQDFLSRPDVWRVLPAERWIATVMPAFRWLVWRHLPAPRRRTFAERIFRAMAPVPHDNPAGFPFYILGHFSSTTGLGESTRLIANPWPSLTTMCAWSMSVSCSRATIF